MEILNRKAKFDYFIEDEIECGIELLGNEVKSIREGSCNIKDSYALIKHGEVYIINMFIKKYSHTSINNFGNIAINNIKNRYDYTISTTTSNK